MEAPTLTDTQNLQASPQVPLFQHTKREEWGLAILAWERGPRRAYQFEDGELRIFKKGYYGMLEEVDAPTDRASQVIAELERKLGNSVAIQNQAPAGRVAQSDLSLGDQIRIFAIQYPEGFEGKEWRKKKRGDTGRQLKRHRDPAIERAHAELSAARIDERIAAGDFVGVRDVCADILAGTDLVTKKQLAPLAELAGARQEPFARALRDLLWNEDEGYELRFERFVGALTLGNPKAASWQLVTALPALVHPDTHMCVRPATCRRQAAWMAPRLSLTQAPNAPTYVRLRDMAASVKEQIVEAGQKPRDLWDVYDFMVDTLKPSAKKLLEQ